VQEGKAVPGEDSTHREGRGKGRIQELRVNTPSTSFPDEPWEKNPLSVRLLKSPRDHRYNKHSPVSSE